MGTESDEGAEAGDGGGFDVAFLRTELSLRVVPWLFASAAAGDALPFGFKH